MRHLMFASLIFASACGAGAPHAVTPTRDTPRAVTVTAPRAVTTTATRAPGSVSYVFRDPFDLGVSAGASDSLGRDLARRQSGALAPIPWSRLGGVWFMAPVPGASSSGLALATGGDGDALVLHGNTAVRLDHAFAPTERGITVRARLDPVLGDIAGQSWSSIILTIDPETPGWVANRDVTPGLLIRSNGRVVLYFRNEERAVAWESGAPEASASYLVSLTLRLENSRAAPSEPRELVAEGDVNGHRYRASLERTTITAMPARVWVVFGAHFHEGETRESAVDDVEVLDAIDGETAR